LETAEKRRVWSRYLPGVLLAGVLAWAAMLLAQVPWFQAHGISALTLAIVLGLLVGNTVYSRLAAASGCGITFSKQWLLRTGIVLYGLRLTFHDIAQVGLVGVLIDGVILSTTFALSCWVGTRVLGLDRKTAMLIGAGSSICGAAAVMAAEPVIRGRSEQVSIAVATVVVFGTLGMFLYPVMFEFAVSHHFFAFSQRAYGIYAGSTIHEVAQVVAAGRAVSESAADTAVITKMVRVMMLAPFLLALSAGLGRTRDGEVPEDGECGVPAPRRVAIPWFALGFIAVIAVNSTQVLPQTWVATGINVDTAILAMAMAALGISTHLSAIKTAGFKPLALAAVLFAWLIVGGFLVNLCLGAIGA
jgi:uncharacterized integral membrane protein (TIGR00698 family)